MLALCGDTTTVPRGEWSKRSDKPGPVASDRIDWDTEFEDPETGGWWVDMDCVNCLRVTNEQRAARERERLEWLLMYFAARPDLIPTRMSPHCCRRWSIGTTRPKGLHRDR
ncbi:hypothetical protein TUM20984_50050 [Mycobacterium antarcticum]|nr:hypothetical protein TUM20984_50050 [Mycolicibacterium sp. TUM20984]